MRADVIGLDEFEALFSTKYRGSESLQRLYAIVAEGRAEIRSRVESNMNKFCDQMEWKSKSREREFIGGSIEDATKHLIEEEKDLEQRIRELEAEENEKEVELQRLQSSLSTTLLNRIIPKNIDLELLTQLRDELRNGA